MGGSNDQAAANRQIEAENRVRQREIEAENERNAATVGKWEYENLYGKAMSDARRKAEEGITAERATGIKESSQLLTDYQAQERSRLFEAKKGTGQIGVGEYGITAEQVEGANTLLGRDADYWSSKRTVAGDVAAATAEKKFRKDTGDEEAYVQQYLKDKGMGGDEERGAAYVGKPRPKDPYDEDFTQGSLFDQTKDREYGVSPRTRTKKPAGKGVGTMMELGGRLAAHTMGDERVKSLFDRVRGGTSKKVGKQPYGR